MSCSACTNKGFIIFTYETHTNYLLLSNSNGSPAARRFSLICVDIIELYIINYLILIRLLNCFNICDVVYACIVVFGQTRSRLIVQEENETSLEASSGILDATTLHTERIL
ncbi:hypothetical protein ACJX0J_024173, partial [Zea mays]